MYKPGNIVTWKKQGYFPKPLYEVVAFKTKGRIVLKNLNYGTSSIYPKILFRKAAPEEIAQSIARKIRGETSNSFETWGQY